MKSLKSIRGSQTRSTMLPLSTRRIWWRCWRTCASSSHRLNQLATDHPHEVAAVTRGSVQIVASVEIVGESVKRIRERAAFERLKIMRDRRVGDTADGKPHAAIGCHRGASHDREVAMPARDFAEGAAVPVARGKFHRLDQLVVIAIGRHHPAEEIARGDAPPFPGA